jgi:phage gp16-like protein
MSNSDPRRRSELGMIHIAKKQIGLDDATYRMIVERISAKFRAQPVSSAGLMDQRERHALIEELKRLGFQPERVERAGGRKKERMAQSPQARKIRACWLDLKALGVLDDPSEKALRHFAQNMTGVGALDWLSPEDANRVIEGLKAWHKREAGKRDALRG